MAKKASTKKPAARKARTAAAAPAPPAQPGPAANRKVLMLVGGPFHQNERAGKVLEELLKRAGGWDLAVTTDLDALAALGSSGTAALVIHTTGFRDDLTPPREKGLLEWVKGGGALVAVHSAADSFRNNRAYIDMINAEFKTHPRFQDIPVRITDRTHYLTARMPDFVIPDELYFLQSHDPARSRILAETTWQGRAMPLVFVHEYGRGRVAYLALGHDLRAWKHPEFQKLILRALRWTTGARLDAETVIRCGLLGYGAAFNMGKAHAGWMKEQGCMQAVAVCDVAAERLAAARAELGDVRTFQSLAEMLAMKDLDLVVNILPHNLHAPTALECLRAGKHVVLEKPFCLTTDEATAMIEAARRGGVMLSCFHNRRWDGDYQALLDIVRRGLVGDLFHVECFSGGYHRPGTWWRSDKTVSGGALYDWGAHFTDWILRLIGKRVTQVTGFFHKRWWQHVTNEDQTEAVMRFEGGETADLQISSLAAAAKPRWRVLGTQGAIAGPQAEKFRVTSFASGGLFEGDVPHPKFFSGAPYYRSVADHLLLKEPLEVTAEQAREVIAVIETAERSSAEGRSLPLPAEVYGG